MKASDGDVAAALRPLVGLPVRVVVRLCTDDDKIADYWNKVTSLSRGVRIATSSQHGRRILLCKQDYVLQEH
jgi:hypothetical protein